jgi:prepilin-type processing-associated H-X9-DG protein
MSMPVRELKEGDVTIHFFATPVVRPAWTISHGVLYAGLYPQVVSAAVANAGAAGHKSILENESFAAMRKRLGHEAEVTCISYLDLPKTAPSIYPAWLFLSGYAGFADLFGAPSPAMLLPPLTGLLANLAPAGSVSWVDEKGWHASGITPFPGARLLASDPTMNLGATALVSGFVLPALHKSREVSTRVQCAGNMKQIGLACLLYSNENKGAYPPDLGTLLKTQDITPDVFICPSSGITFPNDLKGANVDKQIAWINANGSYVYLGKGMNNSASADHVIMYEKKEDHDHDGMNMLYGDGHVEWKTMPQAEAEIARANATKAK